MNYTDHVLSMLWSNISNIYQTTFNYDIHHLMKYSYKDGHGTMSKSVNGKQLEQIELLNSATDGAGVMLEGKITSLLNTRTTTVYCLGYINHLTF